MTTTRDADTPHVDPDYPLQPVPRHARRGLLSLGVVLLGFTFFTPTMLAGAQLGSAYSLGQLIWVIVAGSALLGAYVAAMAVIGARTGLTAVLLARYTLGTGGAKWADLLLGGTQVGWYGVTVAFLAELLVAAFGLEGQTAMLMLVGSLLMGVTAYFGYKGMEALSAVSVPLMAILCGWVVIRALGEVGGVSGLSQIEGGEPIAFGAALTIIVGTFASGGTQVPNWSRFARTGRHALYAALIAFFIGEIFMLGFGAIGALAFSEGDFVQVLLNLGLVFWAVILLLLNLWTTNDNTAYAFGVAGAELFNVPSKKPFVIGGVILGTIIALSGIYEFLPGFLVLLGVFIPPLGGAIIGDYLFVWRGELPDFDTVRLPVIRYSCVAAYVLGTLVAYVTAEAGIGVPPLHGVLIAGLAVPLFERVLRAAGIDQLAQAIDTRVAQ